MINLAVPKETTARERVEEKLSNICSDIKNSRIQTSINTIEKTDGKITATFNINGLPSRKDSPGDDYRNIRKIFDGMEDFAEYAGSFFAKSPEELISLADTEKSK